MKECFTQGEHVEEDPKEKMERYQREIHISLEETLVKNSPFYKYMISKGIKFDFSKSIEIAEGQTFLDVITFVENYPKKME